MVALRERNDLRPPEGRTELANGERFAGLFGDRARYCPAWQRWLVWDGAHWAIDNGPSAESLAKQVADRLWSDLDRSDPDQVQFGRASSSARGVSATLKMASSEPGMQIDPAALDVDPMLLNVSNGTIDLRTGQRRDHDPEDFCTKLAPVAFDAVASCPAWERFIDHTFDGNADLIAFVQRLLGYCLTGSVREQVLPIFHGAGANGKSTLIGVMLNLLGPGYSMQAPPELLVANSEARHPTSIAGLFGKRFVAAIETSEDAKLNETMVKQLTGGDKISARRMREDFWEFAPTHKIVMATNHEPSVRGDGHAIWRRLKKVPFGVVVPDDRQDKQLPEKLRGELPGILKWCLTGCLAWQGGGLGECEAVTSATSGYRRDQDAIGRFLGEMCVKASGAFVGATALHDAYSQWCANSSEQPCNQRQFGRAMTDKGFVRRVNNGIKYLGVKLATEPTEETEGNS
jgi:putative DNA primase/helicase